MNSDLSDLQAKIKAAQKSKSGKEVKPQAEGESSRAGAQAGIELVVAIFAGGGLGYALDSWLETRPAFMLLGFLFGTITGFYNVYKISNNLGAAVGTQKDDNSGLNDE